MEPYKCFILATDLSMPIVEWSNLIIRMTGDLGSFLLSNRQFVDTWWACESVMDESFAALIIVCSFYFPHAT